MRNPQRVPPCGVTFDRRRSNEPVRLITTMTYPTNRPELLRRFNTGEAFDFVFFWGHQPKIGQTVDQHCLSQWFAAPFEIDGILYPTAEHFMMAEKARLFRDATTLAAILQAKDPGTVKSLGRKISGFIQSEWEQQRFEIVVRGNYAKFVQNSALNDYLQSTADCILVEASPYDPIWGIGLAEQDEAVHNPNQWRGLNLLGFAIMAVRANLCNDRPDSLHTL